MKSIRNKITTLLLLLPIFAVAAFYACSSDDGTDSVTPATGSEITSDETITLTFAKEIDPATLELSGNIADSSDGGTWSADHKTLTIKPSDKWDLTTVGQLTVDAKDTDGTAISTVDLVYSVGINLTKFQRAAVVIGQDNFSDRSSSTTSSTFNAPMQMLAMIKANCFCQIIAITAV